MFNDPAQCSFSKPCGLFINNNNCVFICDNGNNCIRKVNNGKVSFVIGKENGFNFKNPTVTKYINTTIFVLDDGKIIANNYNDQKQSYILYNKNAVAFDINGNDIYILEKL